MNEMRDLKDSLDSLHQRMDRFYAWASQLQVEMRNVQQRVKFLENTLENNASFNNMNTMLGDQSKTNEKVEDAVTEASLLERLNRFKQRPN
jgi:hypothetical protein